MPEITHHATRSAQLAEGETRLDADFTGDGSGTMKVFLRIHGGGGSSYGGNYGTISTTLEALREFMAALEQEAFLARQQNCH